MELALDVRPLSNLFKALGDETRLRIVALLSHGELCVCHVETALGLNQPTASRHLAILKNAGIVEPRRQGTWIHYRLSPLLDVASQRQLRLLVKGFGQQLLQKDIERLLQSRGPESCR